VKLYPGKQDVKIILYAQVEIPQNWMPLSIRLNVEKDNYYFSVIPQILIINY
jgi:hypothetical protein